MDFSHLNRGQITLMGSAFCVMLTMHFTLQLLSQHLFYWKNPKEQKAILIIILMAPIYAIDSFVGLLDVRGSKAFFMFLESVKECYEALVIAKFLALMYSYLNISISKNIVPDEIKGREIHHSFPMTLFQPRTVRLNHRTLKLLKHWTWQFVVIRPVCSILMIILQSWHLTSHLQSSCASRGLFSSAFGRGVVLDILVAMGIIRSHHFWLDVEHLEEALQNVLVCLEMVVFSVLQQYAYHVAPYSGEVEAKMKLGKKNE
ncbi:Uncharacterized protein TCM_029966 isoform 2 [Theobroma cacao]|uniref:Uncharacterized protein isoform 2 n=1 Tax=Theobroma cacao TaxID=3641 RepID=A0A061GGU4_THECC|nr:Uncharacterized protein TCM_029966 isoform 2 [Theobroma cacao]